VSPRAARLLACAALLGACAPSGERAAASSTPAEAPGAPSAPEPPTEDPEVKPVNDPETGPEGEAIVTVEGVLDIDRVPGGKRFQGVWLETASGRYVITYRPHARYFPFVEKRVAVTGYVEHIPPHVQSIGATHFVVQDIALAPGESPHDPVPTDLLPPRPVRAGAEVAAAAGRWVQAVATLKGSTPTDSSTWVEANLDVGGEPVKVTLSAHLYEKHWARLEGQTLTVPGRLSQGTPRELYVADSSRVCAGEDLGCWRPRAGAPAGMKGKLPTK
jgi:hypothetical protein